MAGLDAVVADKVVDWFAKPLCDPHARDVIFTMVLDGVVVGKFWKGRE